MIPQNRFSQTRIVKLSILFNLLMFNCTAQSTNYSSMMEACKNYSEEYHPTYIVGNDTLIVSLISRPPDSINNFLFNCIKKRNFEPLKYAIVILMKQRRIYSKENGTDFVMDNADYKKNGFIEMIRVFLGLKKDANAYLSPLFTGDICYKLFQDSLKINDFQYIHKALKD